ncbi:hypothetical protein PsorP6_001845 [Peronosclerospora sorghi]|uniref:Uncharacterized protein n=1 Tax=Peronosclerospora sorghi TaxID=230839 RepID=A0ACC0WSX6_9STRA|nr:hypothetical protein PsorP6_001845 [Peronosclerospora sorghi]
MLVVKRSMCGKDKKDPQEQPRNATEWKFRINIQLPHKCHVTRKQDGKGEAALRCVRVFSDDIGLDANVEDKYMKARLEKNVLGGKPEKKAAVLDHIARASDSPAQIPCSVRTTFRFHRSKSHFLSRFQEATLVQTYINV